MTPNYAYCQYFQKEYDPSIQDCYTTVGGYIARFFLGDVLTNFLYREDTNSIQASLPKITRIGPSAREITLDSGETVDLTKKKAGEYKRILRSLLRRDEMSDYDHPKTKNNDTISELIYRYFSAYNSKDLNSYKEEDVHGLVNDLFILFTKLSLNKEDIKQLFLTEVIHINLTSEEKRKFMLLFNILLKFNDNIITPLISSTPISPSLNFTPYSKQQQLPNSQYFSVTQKKMKRDLNDLRPIPYKSVESFWSAPIENLAIKIWEDLISLGGESFNFMDNIIANIGVDVLIDRKIHLLITGSKRITSKLSNSLISKLSVKAGIKAASYFVVASVSRKIVGLAVKTMVKVAVQMSSLSKCIVWKPKDFGHFMSSN